jgi:hypothetical protein
VLAQRFELVEEQRPAARLRDQAVACFLRIGEGAAGVAEEFALDEAVGDRAAVHRKERRIPPRAEMMDGARGQLLSGARLTGDEHRNVQRRHLTDQLQRALKAGGVANEIEAGERLPIGDVLGIILVRPWSHGFLQAPPNNCCRQTRSSDLLNVRRGPYAQVARKISSSTAI